MMKGHAATRDRADNHSRFTNLATDQIALHACDETMRPNAFSVASIDKVHAAIAGAALRLASPGIGCRIRRRFVNSLR